MLSRPPATAISSSPEAIRAAIPAMVWRPEAQNRFTVTPPTLAGSPASSTAMRAMFRPCSASGIAQPTIASSMVAGSSPGTCASAPRIACTSRSSGRVWRNTPRGALPTGVRVAATM